MPKKLQTRREKILEKISSIGPVLKGSLSEVSLTCGKKNCRCQRGPRHQAFYFSYRKRGETKVVHLPSTLVAQARQFQKNWHRLKDLMEEFAEVQIALWKENAREEKERAKRQQRCNGGGRRATR